MRKTSIVTISEQNRDFNKSFLVTEMPALKAEKWAARALLALSRSGIDVPEELQAMGFIGLAIFGLKFISGISFGELEPLMDEMMGCVQIAPNPRDPSVVRPLLLRGTEGDDIEEVATLAILRTEVISIHVGFTSRGALLSFLRGIGETASAASQNTSTSPGSSETSSP